MVRGPIVPTVRLKRKSQVSFLSSCGGGDAGQRLLSEPFLARLLKDEHERSVANPFPTRGRTCRML